MSHYAIIKRYFSDEYDILLITDNEFLAFSTYDLYKKQGERCVLINYLDIKGHLTDLD